MIQRLLLAFCLLLSYLSAFSQQPSQYSLYMFNTAQYNPAYAGMGNSLLLTGIYRKQWQGITQSPNQQNITLHAPIYRLSGGIGINVENDKLGLERNLHTTLSYNFQLPIGRSSKFSIGIAGGIFQKTLDGANIRTPEGTYTNTGIIEHNDALPLPNNNVSAITPIFNAGIYFKNKRFEMGVSAINVQEPKIEGDFFSTQLSRNYFFTAAYNIDLNRSISVHPSILLKTDQTEWQSEASLLFKYDDNIFLGGSLRGYNTNTFDAAVLIAGLDISEKIKLAYAYDFTLSDLNVISDGSHELMLQYNLGTDIGKGKLPKIIFNPRFQEQ